MELLIMITDRAAWQRGDVVSVLPDGADWGRDTPTHDFWRIIRAPILTTLADALQANGSDRHRDWTVDVDQLPPATGFITNAPAEVVTAASRRK